MAWIKVSEQGHLNDSENAGEKTAKRIFVAISDTPTTPVAAETASFGAVTIPVLGEAHPDDATRKVKSISAKAEQNSPRKVFVVEVEYSSKSTGFGTIPEDPLDRDDEITWDFEDATEPYFIDRTTPTPKTVVNSAGERFAEFLERDTGSIIATVTRNVAPNGYDPTTAVQFKDAVNTDGFTIDGVSISANQAKMKSYTAGPVQEENNIDFRQVKIVLQFKANWDHVVEDRGFNEKDAATGKLKEILKGDKPPTKVDTPWPLNGSGAKKTNSTDAPSTLTFVPYNKLAFSPFNFA